MALIWLVRALKYRKVRERRANERAEPSEEKRRIEREFQYSGVFEDPTSCFRGVFELKSLLVLLAQCSIYVVFHNLVDSV